MTFIVAIRKYFLADQSQTQWAAVATVSLLIIVPLHRLTRFMSSRTSMYTIVDAGKEVVGLDADRASPPITAAPELVAVSASNVAAVRTAIRNWMEVRVVVLAFSWSCMFVSPCLLVVVVLVTRP
ncbi:MAG: hypothetical protein V9G12_23175 [Microthrixaceae bacterium]